METGRGIQRRQFVSTLGEDSEKVLSDLRQQSNFSSICLYLLYNRFVDWQHIPFYGATLRTNRLGEQNGGKTGHTRC